MRDWSVGVFAVTALVVLAGCNAPNGSDLRPTYDVPETVTDRAEDDDSVVGREDEDEDRDRDGEEAVTEPVTPPADEDDALGPGLIRAGVYDARTLTTAHRRALTNRSVSVTRETVVYELDGSVRRAVRIRTAVAANRTRFLVSTTTTGPAAGEDARTVTWSAGTDAPVVVVTVGPDGRSLRETDPATRGVESVVYGAPVFTDRLVELLAATAAGDTSVTASTTPDAASPYANGTAPTSYLVRATDVPPGTIDMSPATTTSLTVTARVAPSGLVRTVGVSYRVDLGFGTARVVDRIAFDGVGRTVVEAPEWGRPTRSAVGGVLGALTLISTPTSTPISGPGSSRGVTA
jgi:hypothetical protein